MISAPLVSQLARKIGPRYFDAVRGSEAAKEAVRRARTYVVFRVAKPLAYHLAVKGHFGLQNWLWNRYYMPWKLYLYAIKGISL
jgi:hypothetical protein